LQWAPGVLKPLSLPEPRDLKDRAHALILKGKLEAAADIYLLLIARNNKDADLRFHHAVVCEKLQRKDRAVASYLVAAHLHVGTGHVAKARAALSAGLRVSPRDPGLTKAMRQLCPPPRLTLVPKHVPHIPFDEIPSDEMVTEPHQIIEEEWCDVVFTNSGAAPREGRTVSQRAPTRARAMTR
jgi:hypothetical protein